MTEYFKIGKLVATFGVKGELLLKHSLGKKTSLKGLEVLFIETRKDEMLPYFIQSTKIKTAEEIYIKLEGADTRETAHALTQKEVWLNKEDFDKYAAKSSPISLLGYQLINEEQPIGEVLEVIEQPHQLLCRILYKNNEALIPVHEQTLQRIDKKNKQVFLVLPDGLLDIYS